MSIARISRRALLTGGLALASTGLLVAGGRGRARAAASKPRRMILVFANGGWDTTYSVDPKPGSAHIDGGPGTVATVGGVPILTAPDRPNVSAYFAAHGGITTILNGVNLATISHPEGTHRIFTGVTDNRAADVAAIAAATFGLDYALPYLVLGRTSFSGEYGAISARTGSVNQIITLLDPLKFAFPVVGKQGLPHIPTAGEEALIRQHVLARAAREGALRPSKRLDDFVGSLERADAIREIGQIGEIEFARDFSAQATLAVEALARDLCYSVQIETGGWDTHENNDQQGPLTDTLFADLRMLVDALSARSSSQGGRLIDETMIVVLSDLGRTPRLNAANGKDHWPVTSAMVIGGGLPGGRVLGATTDLLDAAGIDLQTGAVDPGAPPLMYGSLAAGLLEAAGIESSEFFNVEPLRALYS